MEYGVVLVWWVAFVALMLIGWPVAGRILRFAPDRGASLSAPAALAVVTLPMLWVGQVSYDAGILVSGVILLACSVLGWRSWLNGGETIPWREFGVTVLVFSAAFGFMLVIRAAAPGIYPGGGEKFLDFGILQSLLRADQLPPLDMWFAGERIVYYYGGHMLAAALAKVTATPGVWAKAPALSGYYALQATAVFGLAQAIVDDWSTPDPGRPRLEVRVGSTVAAGVLGYWLFGVQLAIVAAPMVYVFLSYSTTRARRAGVFAAFWFAFASNLLTPLRLAARHLSPETLGWVTRAFGPDRDLQPTVSPETFSYWPASRVIPDTINEFPLFAFRNGDLHAHMMSPTILLLLVGVLFAFYRTPASEPRRRRYLLASTLPLVAIILFVNVWSFPTALGLVALGVAASRDPPWTRIDGLAEWQPPRIGAEVSRVVLGVLVAAVAGLVTVGLVWPFVDNVLLAGADGRHPGFLPTRSGLGPFVIVHGVFIALFAGYLVNRGVESRRRVIGVLLLVPILVVAGWRLDLVGLFLVGPLIAAGWWALRTDRAGFEALLVVAAGGLVVLVEFAYLVDNAAPERFNTVFKVYYQAWTLWAIALGVVCASFSGRHLDARGPSTGALDSLRLHGRQVAAPAAVAFLVVTTSIYGGLVVTQHVGNADEYSLDGMTYAHTQYPGEAEAIEWIMDLEGQPTLVSMPCTAVYSWCNPEASLTGVPTVLGWGHEALYRGGDAYHSRQTVVSALYDTDDPYSRAVLLEKFEVDYIYVGPRERDRYETIDYAREPGISVAFANQQVVIYEVDRAELTDEPR